MNILIDFLKHSDLFYSLYKLFGERLGYTVYTPVGKEWLEQGLMGMCEDPGGHYEIEGLESVSQENGISYYHRKMEPDGQRYLVRGIPPEKLSGIKFDVVLTSVYLNEHSFYKLVRDLQPEAKFIRQIANIHEKPLGYCKNVLLGAAYHPSDFGGELDPQKAFKARGENVFVYYPEHHEGYSYTPPTNSKSVICLSRHIAPPDLAIWNLYRNELEPLGFSFKMYGLQYQPYDIDPIYGESIPHLLLAKAIKEAGFVWYTKPNGGGGYTVREALAVGRPVIVRRSYSSAHTSIECELFRHTINCIDLDHCSDTSIIREWSKSAVHQLICKQTAEMFQADVKFEETARKIGIWIDTLPRGV